MPNFCAPIPLVSPVLRDDLPRYPPLIQVCRVTGDIVSGTTPPPNLYISYTQQVDTVTYLPADEEVCVVTDLTGDGLTDGYYVCRLVGTFTTSTTVGIITYFDDDFNGPDVPLTSHTPIIGGAWANFGSGSAAQTLSGSLAPDTGVPDGTQGQYNDATSVDYTAEFNWTNNTSSNWPAFCVRLNPANGNGYWILNEGTNNNVDLYQSVAGVLTLLATTNTSTGGTNAFKIVLSGSNISIYINTVLKISYASASINPTETHFGVSFWDTGSNSTVRIDDLLITSGVGGIIGSPIAQVLTPASMLGIFNGMTIIVGSGSAYEQSVITAVSSTTFTAIVRNTYVGSTPVLAMCPIYAVGPVTVSGITGSGTNSYITIWSGTTSLTTGNAYVYNFGTTPSIYVFTDGIGIQNEIDSLSDATTYDDWVPSDDNAVIALNITGGSGGDATITGIEERATSSDQSEVLFLFNWDDVGVPSNITLSSNSTGSTTDNKLRLPENRDVVLKPGDGIILYHFPSADSGWFCLGMSQPQRYRPAFDNWSAANNSGTGETDLYSNTLPGLFFSFDGDKLSAVYAGTFTGAALSTQRLRAYFNGTVVFDSGALNIGAAATNSWNLKIDIIADVTNSAVRCTTTITSDFTTLPASSTYIDVTSITFTGTIIIKITGEAAGAGGGSNQITAALGFGEFKMAAN